MAGASYNNGSNASIFASNGNNWDAGNNNYNGSARVAFLECIGSGAMNLRSGRYDLRHLLFERMDDL